MWGLFFSFPCHCASDRTERHQTLTDAIAPSGKVGEKVQKYTSGTVPELRQQRRAASAGTESRLGRRSLAD